MKTSILISTTESIEGMKIEKYLDFISTNVVLGTNVFSDIGASFSDFFGGTSEIYQNKLDRIYKSAIDKLKQKTQALGANGIIGLRLDFDEISGKGKSMFMVSASGMAVRLKQIDSNIKIDPEQKYISHEDIESQVTKLKIINSIKNKNRPTEDEMNFLLEFPIEEIVPDLLEIYLNIFKDGPWATSDYQKSIRAFLPSYLRNINQELVSTTLYSKIEENPDIISTLLKESLSFDPKLALRLIENGKIHSSILTLESSKKNYNLEDLKIMNTILDKLNNLPNTGKIENVKSILGGTKEKFICEKNHTNDIDKEFCQTEGCRRNIKGLRNSEIDIIDEFLLKTESLKIILGE